MVFISLEVDRLTQNRPKRDAARWLRQIMRKDVGTAQFYVKEGLVFRQVLGQMAQHLGSAGDICSEVA